jgi:hypothetical protein
MKIAELQKLASELFSSYPAVSEKFQELTGKQPGTSYFDFRDLYCFMEISGLDIAMTTDGADYLYIIDNSRNSRINMLIEKEVPFRSREINYAGDVTGFIMAGFFYMNLLYSGQRAQMGNRSFVQNVA